MWNFSGLSGRNNLQHKQKNAMGKFTWGFPSVTKLLGTPFGGGRRRSTSALGIRLTVFKKRIPLIHALRKAGVHVKQLVRAAGTPAVMYGVEVIGMYWHGRSPAAEDSQRHCQSGGSGRIWQECCWLVMVPAEPLIQPSMLMFCRSRHGRLLGGRGGGR